MTAHENDHRTKDQRAKKTEHKTDELKGRAKEAAGKLTDDEALEAQGKGDQVTSNLKQAGDKVKDAFKK